MKSPISLARRAALEAQHDNPGVPRLRWPRDQGESFGYGNLLHAIPGVSDHAASDAAAGSERTSPEFLPGGGIQCVEISAEVSDEHDSTGRRRDGGNHGIGGIDTHSP